MIIDIILLLLSIPVGFLIAWLARDELMQGRKWLKILIVISVIGAIVFYFMKNMPVTFTFVFIIIVSVVSLVKSYDKKWAVRYKS